MAPKEDWVRGLQDELPRTMTLREAADLCDLKLSALRSRADRGSLKVVRHDGERHVALSELERLGLLPDAELRALRRRVEELQSQLASVRQLVADTERERQQRQQLECELQVARGNAAAATAAQERTQQQLDALDAELADAGPIKAWKIARARRRAAQTLSTKV